MLESIKGLNVVEKKGVPFLQFEIFKNQPVIHGFSTRLGGVSRGEWSSMNISFTRGDNEADVKENHERLAAAVGYRTEDLVLTKPIFCVSGKKIPVMFTAIQIVEFVRLTDW